MSFVYPNILWLLLFFPTAMTAFFWWSSKKQQELRTRFIQARLLPGLVAGISLVRQRIRLACVVLAVACLIVALARPQWGFVWQEVKQKGVDIVVAIDTSKSMLAEDIAPNRLARAKLAAMDLMQLAKGDRLGLVAFAGNAFLQCPLTIDDVAFRQSLDTLDVNTIPQGGTALAEAIETAQTAFKEGDNHRVLVLMTDGEDHDSGALEAAQKAAQAGLKIYTIGIGTPEGELLRIKDPQGRTDYIRDEGGNVVKSHLNERLLQEIAGATQGGFYLPLRGAKTIDALYAEGLAKLPKSEHQERLIKQAQDRYHWPLACAILLLAVEMLLPERKRESRTGATLSRKTRLPLETATALVFFLTIPALVWASPSSALREYNAGKYEQSLKEYEQLLQRRKEDPRLHFNAGAAAYRNRQFEEAAKQFNEAVGAPDLKLQGLAYYNRGNAQYRLGEQISDPAKRTEAWEKAVKDYELSLKLNSQDPDAKFNREFVKKMLEELKQQQQQQQKSQQNKSDQDQKQDQQQQKQNQQQDSSKQDQQQAQEKQSGQKDENEQQDQQRANKQQEDQKKQQAAKQNPDQTQKQKEQAAQPAQAKPEDEEKKDENSALEGEMTAEQAQQLLDEQKAEEKLLPAKPDAKPTDTNKRIKDW